MSFPNPEPPGRRELERLAEFLRGRERLFVLTGAGCSTASGIPDYRDEGGDWKRRQPMRFGEFVRRPSSRRRYWARSFVAWPSFSASRPNRAHRVLARWDDAGRIRRLVTQNVDGLHQAAGASRVLDLHGRLSVVRCLGCGRGSDRHELQERFAAGNAELAGVTASPAPDGDADLDPHWEETFRVPDCRFCGGVLKPDVVFFGESVPPGRVAHAMDELARSDAVLVVGSSLMVWSGFRFAKAAAERELPIAIVNLGKTRADELAAVKVEAECGDVLEALDPPPERAGRPAGNPSAHDPSNGKRPGPVSGGRTTRTA